MENWDGTGGCVSWRDAFTSSLFQLFFNLVWSRVPASYLNCVFCASLADCGLCLSVLSFLSSVSASVGNVSQMADPLRKKKKKSKKLTYFLNNPNECIWNGGIQTSKAGSSLASYNVFFLYPTSQGIEKDIESWKIFPLSLHPGKFKRVGIHHDVSNIRYHLKHMLHTDMRG